MCSNELKDMVRDDITLADQIWAEYSQDRGKMEELFNYLLHRYADVIDGFEQGLRVITGFEDKADQALSHRENVWHQIQTLKRFRDCGCDNSLMSGGSALKDRQLSLTLGEQSFMEARRELERLELTAARLAEISDKIDEIQEICTKVAPASVKWEHLRPYLVWTSGKDERVAGIILPLFLNVL